MLAAIARADEAGPSGKGGKQHHQTVMEMSYTLWEQLVKVCEAWVVVVLNHCILFWQAFKITKPMIPTRVYE